jgi:MFS family permease
VAGILPLFLTSTLAPELRADLEFSTAQLGMAVAVFFAAAAIASGPLGWLGERLGAGRSLCIAAVTSAASMVALALAARSWAVLAVALAVAGLAQALIEPAANLYLARRIDPSRLGFAFGISEVRILG